MGDIADPEGLGPRAFTHVASQHAGIVVRSMLFRLPGTRLDYAALPRVTYTDPELAQVGLTEAEAREAGHRDVSRAALAAARRTTARWPRGGRKGWSSWWSGRRGRLLGAGILAPRAGEMAGLYGLMIGRQLPLSALAGMVLPYPTLSEAGKRAAGRVLHAKVVVAVHETSYRLAEAPALALRPRTAAARGTADT